MNFPYHFVHERATFCISLLTEFILHPYRPVFVTRYDRNYFMIGGGGPLECLGGYQARPKIHVIRVVFQDQALYARTSFRGAKTCKIGKKGVFLVI